jgi:SAM-dependent methyltransferase
MGELLKLNLGCGHKLREGWVNVDRVERDGVDVVHDLNDIPWPFDDDSADEIAAISVVEHLPCGLAAFMEEAWRVLVKDGRLEVVTPSHFSQNAWRDPTHIRPYHPDAFRYFDPSTEWGGKYFEFVATRPWRVYSIITDKDQNVRAIMQPDKGGRE